MAEVDRGTAEPSPGRSRRGLSRGEPSADPTVSHEHASRDDGARSESAPVLMNCTEVVSHFSDYLDGTASEADVAEIDRHLGECTTCVRYHNVLVHGTAVLRTLPEPELREDFVPRLRHRLYHVDDERTLHAHASSGAPAMTVLGIALLLTAVAWSPLLVSRAPVVQLAPIVVDRAPERAPFRPASSPPGMFSTKSDPDLADGLWDGTLLYEYTPLSQRYRGRARVRRVVQTDR
jgi:anti-sigma factor RsiW